MPPLPVVPATARFTLHTQFAGGPVALTRFFQKYTGAISGTDATTLCGTLATSWNTRLAGSLGSQVTLIAAQCDDLGSKTGVNVVSTVSHPGSNASNSVPAGVAFVMSAHVAYKYRGGHSRVYLPGVAQQYLQDSNTWTTAFLGTMFTAWTGIISDLQNSPPVGVGALSSVSVHAYSSNPDDFPGGPPSKPPPWPLATPVTYPITSWSTNPQTGSQRRRNQQ